MKSVLSLSQVITTDLYSVWVGSVSLRKCWIHKISLISKLCYYYRSIFCLGQKHFSKIVLDSSNQSYH